MCSGEKRSFATAEKHREDNWLSRVKSAQVPSGGANQFHMSIGGNIQQYGKRNPVEGEGDPVETSRLLSKKKIQQRSKEIEKNSLDGSKESPPLQRGWKATV